MCPAQVPYARLSNDFRSEAFSSSDNKLKPLEQSAVNLLTSPYRKSLNTLLRLYQKFGFNRLPFQLNDYLPTKSSGNNFKPTHPFLSSAKRGHVALFTGCASEVLDSKTLKDAIFLLQHCGFDITIPKKQSCCGAIDLHAGNKNKASALSQNNQLAFSDDDYDAVITVASGCGSTLAEYDSPLASKVIDISDFIAAFLSALSFEPLKASAWLHTPCTLKNAQSKGTNIAGLLSNISELNVQSFSTDQMCCGAAGTHMLTHKETANTLRNQTLEPLKRHATDYLLTSNIGCAMHLRAGLKSAGLNSKVLHPVSLLAQQLKV